MTRPLIAAVLMPLVLAGCFGKPADIGAYLERAHQNLAQGEREKAKIELQNALRLQPASPVANLELAQLEDADGDLQAAVPLYLRAATPEARQIDAQLRIVEILLDSNRFVEASGRINTTLGSFPDNTQALALRADLEERQGQDSAARNDVASALQRDGRNARALSVSALLALKGKNGQQALDLVSKGLAAHPDDLRLLQVQAAALLTLDQPDKAVEALKTVVRTAPRNIAAQVALADVETSEGRFDAAFQRLRDAVAADPTNQDLKGALIGFLARHKKEADLVAYLTDEIGRNPKIAVYDLLLAEFDRTHGNLDGAEQVLSKAATRLAGSDESRTVRVALAKIAGARGNVASAATQLDAVLAQDPGNKDALLYRAVLEIGGGQAGSAVSDAAKVTRADPVNGQAYEILATAYMQLGQPKLAIDSMRRAVAVAPGDDGAQMRLAAFLQRAGDTNGARDIAARQTLSHPDASGIWVTAAQLAIERRDWDQAVNAVSHLRDIAGMADAAASLDAQIQAGRGNPAKAAATFRGLIDGSPDIDPTIIGAFASSGVAAKQTDAASAYLRGRAPALSSPERVAAWSAVMAMEADAGRFDASNAAYAETFKLAPANLATLRTHVRILLSQKSFDAAARAIEAAKQAGAPASDCAILMGGVAEARGDLAAAQASYKQALDANPLSADALNNYASLAADHDAKDLALLGQLRDRLSGLEASANPNLVDTIAWLDYRLGRFDEAKALLTRIGAAQSDNPQLRFHAAAVMLASGDKQAATAILETVKDKSFPGVEEARALASM